jgi:hypothetical protein
VGSIYSASAYIYFPDTNTQTSGVFTLSISWYNSGTLISTVSSTAVTVTDTSGWVRVVFENQVAPATSTNANISIVQTSGTNTSGDVFYIDAIKFENYISATQYTNDFPQAVETRVVNAALSNVFPGDPLTKPYITGLQLKADIGINKLILNTIDEDNVIWVCTDIKGWWELPSPEVPNITRGLDDGSYNVRGRWTARDITVEGSILPPKSDYLPAARSKLMAALAELVYVGGYMYVDESPVKVSYVYMVGQPVFEVVNARGRLNFTISLRAGDPVKYNWNNNSTDGYYSANIPTDGTSTVSVNNLGSAAVTVAVQLSGPLGASTSGTATSIVNQTNGNTMKIIKPLRTASYLGTSSITYASRTSNYVTVTTSAAHGLFTSDVVSVVVSGTDTYYIASAAATITSTTLNTFTYYDIGTDTSGTVSVTATATLANTDTLAIDTYNSTILYRGLADSARSLLDANLQWLKLEPGINVIKLNKATSETPTAASIKWRSGWIG